MGYKTYGEDEKPCARWKAFIGWLVLFSLWFPYAIGGWLVHFGMPVEWMAALTCVVAIVAAWRLSKAAS
jgi:hypothetical protein